MSDTLSFRTSKSIPDNALTLLIRRLEAATSRLEDIAGASPNLDQTDGTRGAPGGGIAQHSSSSAPELPTATGATSSSGPAKPSLPSAIGDMDKLIAEEVANFVGASKSLDSNIADQVRCERLLPNVRITNT